MPIEMSSFLFVCTWNSISSLDTWYHFRFNISCGDSIKIRVETPEKFFLSVALLSQARKSECGMAHNTLVDLIFVRTVDIPNLSLLPCLELA